MQVGELLAGMRKQVKVRRKGDVRQVAFEIKGIAFAVGGMVQQAIDVIEDIPFADGGVVVVGAELIDRPIGNILAAVAAVFVVGVEGEALMAVGC